MEDKKINFNNVPPTSAIAKRVKPFGMNDVASYRIVGSYNPVTKKRHLRDVFVPAMDVITDPETSDTYQIAFIQNVKVDGTVNLGEILFSGGGLCTRVLRGSNATDKRLYNFLEQSNFLKDNPHRDPSINALVERFEGDTDGAALRKMRRDKQEAMNILADMNDVEITSFLIANDLRVYPTEQTRRDFLEEHIEKGEGSAFLKSSISVSNVQGFIDQVEAFKKKELVAFDKKAGVWSLRSGELLYKITKGIGVSPVADFAKFLSTPAGAEALAKIKEG